MLFTLFSYIDKPTFASRPLITLVFLYGLWLDYGGHWERGSMGKGFCLERKKITNFGRFNFLSEKVKICKKSENLQKKSKFAQNVKFSKKIWSNTQFLSTKINQFQPDFFHDAIRLVRSMDDILGGRSEPARKSTNSDPTLRTRF